MPASDSTVFAPEKARHFDLIHKELQFTPEELVLLAKSGFIISDRLTFDDHFKRAYAWIYWKDLPVLVTTDSLLHAVHRTYDELVKNLETHVLSPKLVTMLRAARDHARSAKAAADERLHPFYDDLDLFLTVPLALLTREKEGSPRAGAYLQTIYGVNGMLHDAGDHDDFDDEPPAAVPADTDSVTLFGLERPVDFNQFYARGHYTDTLALTQYFMAMMWLAHVDFRLVDYTRHGSTRVNIGQMVGAHLLYAAIDQSGQRAAWDECDGLLSAFTGASDNMTLRGLERFIADAVMRSPADFFDAPEDDLLALLLRNDYGKQRVSGGRQDTAPGQTLPHPVAFALMGQRFTIESRILGELAFDRLTVNGEKVERAYPSPLDAMAALGSDRAKTHLHDELLKYGYAARLDELRAEVDTLGDDFWAGSFYNRWLAMIRALNTAPQGDFVPRSMQAEAWADKTLHTQLASWTQLRHDHILYTKQPDEAEPICEYPAGYVEPYIEFYQAMQAYARYGRDVFQRFSLPPTDMPVEQAEAQAKTMRYHDGEEFFAPYRQANIRQTALTYFARLEEIAAQLETLARKELNGENFSEAETLFMRSIIVRKYIGDEHYGGWSEEHWNGWYNDLLPFDDKSPKLVTDMYTNRNAEIGTPGILHIGTGDAVVIACLVNTDAGDALYVGAAFTYYEHLVTGENARPLRDEKWNPRSYDTEDYARRHAYQDEQQKKLREEIDTLKGNLAYYSDFDSPDSKAERITMRLELLAQIDVLNQAVRTAGLPEAEKLELYRQRDALMYRHIELDDSPSARVTVEERYNSLLAKIAEHEKAIARIENPPRPVMVPAWTASFRLSTGAVQKLALPNALEGLGLSEADIEALYSNRILDYGWGGDGAVVGLARAVRDNPARVLAALRFNVLKLAALRRKLKAGGHFDNLHDAPPKKASRAKPAQGESQVEGLLRKIRNLGKTDAE